MLDEKTLEELKPVLFSSRMIVFALCLGALFFGGIVLLASGPDEASLGPLTQVALALGIGGAVMGGIIPKLVVNSGRSSMVADTKNDQGQQLETDSRKLGSMYQTKTVIGCALLEGPTFMSLIAYLSEGYFPALIAAGLLILGIAFQFPTETRLYAWVEDHLQAVAEERIFRDGISEQ